MANDLVATVPDLSGKLAVVTGSTAASGSAWLSASLRAAPTS